MILRGKSALVTGASIGFGAAIAEKLVAEGASVMLCARDDERLTAFGRELRAKAGEGQRVEWRRCDVASEADADALVATTLELFPDLLALVNNAGVYGPLGPIEEIDWEDWKRSIAINLFGPIYLSRLLTPHFKRKRYGKIVNVSGGGATSPLPRISSYAAAKAGLVRMTETLAAELREDNVDVNAIAPGVLDTRLTHQLLAAGPEAVGEGIHARVNKQAESGAMAMAKGVDLCAFLCSSACDGITGKLIAAVWDPWHDLPKHRQALADSDIYALRRILPSDRGQDWGG
jgi:NAD(P)-dependent dehydrogenase (short-subunit alcohol dehydrogenase family)